LLAAQRAQSGGGSSRAAARRRVAAQAALGGSSTAQPLQVNPPQIRTSDGKMGPAIQPVVGGQLAKARSLAMSRGVNPMQGPRPQSQAGALAQARSLALSGGVNPITGQTAPPPVGQPPTGGTPPTSPTGPTDFAGLRKQIEAFGPAPTLDAATLAKMRAQESMRLANIQRGNLAGLGAAAAGQGGVGSGGVASIAAGFGAERMRAETDLGVKYAGLQNQQAREDYNRNFGLAGDLAKLREQQSYGTSERMGSQAYNSEEAQKNRAFAGDQNAQDRLASMALAEKNIAAQKANLDTQIAAASAENNLDRVQQLTMQRNQLDQNEKQMAQQNDQFLASIGLDRDRFNKASEQFDLTRGDQVAQFASNLDLQNRQMEQQGNQFTANLAQNLTIANMDDATRRWMTQLQADMNNPTEFQAALSALGTIASIPGLGERIFGGLLGGAGAAGGAAGAAAGAGGAGAATGAATGAGIGTAATVGAAAIGAAVGAGLIYKAFEPGSGPAWDAAAGQFMAGPIGQAFGGLIGFGKDDRQHAQDEFTTLFDDTFVRDPAVQASMNLPANDPKSFWNPVNRYGAAKALEGAFTQATKEGTGKVEISEPDMNRMKGLGLVADVGAMDRSRPYLIDDPKLLAIAGKGNFNDQFEIVMPDWARNSDRVWDQYDGSMSKLLAGIPDLKIKDKKSGKVIDMKNPKILKGLADQRMREANSSSLGEAGSAMEKDLIARGWTPEQAYQRARMRDQTQSIVENTRGAREFFGGAS